MLCLRIKFMEVARLNEATVNLASDFGTYNSKKIQSTHWQEKMLSKLTTLICTLPIKRRTKYLLPSKRKTKHSKDVNLKDVRISKAQTNNYL